MYVLGIETSCDETSAAVVKAGKEVLSNEVSSSLAFHSKYGGVIPEIASRAQLETITDVVDMALRNAGVDLKKIGLISVTTEPGLPGSLLVGTSFAMALGLASGIPVIGVNHIYSHIYANFLNKRKIKLPFVGLVVSGGHTNLFYIKDFHNIEVLGETQDDACGEAFDKVAKILGLGYPGGRAIEKLAEKGDRRKIKFSCCGTDKPLNFSFSGIKTAVLYYARKHLDFKSKASKQLISDIAASFQETVLDSLAKKSLLACKLKKAKRLVVGGGVVANSRLREKLSAAAGSEGIECYCPPKGLCLDNAAMVAGFGYVLFRKGG